MDGADPKPEVPEPHAGGWEKQGYQEGVGSARGSWRGEHPPSASAWAVRSGVRSSGTVSAYSRLHSVTAARWRRTLRQAAGAAAPGQARNRRRHQGTADRAWGTFNLAYCCSSSSRLASSPAEHSGPCPPAQAAHGRHEHLNDVSRPTQQHPSVQQPAGSMDSADSVESAAWGNLRRRGGPGTRQAMQVGCAAERQLVPPTCRQAAQHARHTACSWGGRAPPGLGILAPIQQHRQQPRLLEQQAPYRL